MRIIALVQILASSFFLHNAVAQTLTGTISNSLTGVPVVNARVTIFLSDTSAFREARTDANGIYTFENVEPYNFIFNVAARNYELHQSVTTAITGLVIHNAELEKETNAGSWTTVVEAPEPLGGTDLGILLPNGHTYYCHNTKDPFAFNPITGDTLMVAGDIKVQGCVAPKLLWNGNIIMAGGTEQEVYGPGTRKIKQFNLSTQTWQALPNMLDYRWYPSLTQLADGRLLIVGGGGLNNPVRVKTSELYDPQTGITKWADTVAIGMEQSPTLILYNGKALMTFRPPQIFDPLTEKWDLASDFLQGNRMPNGDHVDHELVHLPEGEVIAIGYKPFPSGSGGKLVERYDYLTDTWSFGAHFAPLRSRPETVLLPDRRILTLAGFKEDAGDPTPVNQWGYMDLTDTYDPYSDVWRRLKPMPRKREYHALAILVPDGRVVVTGGEGQPGNEPPQSIIDVFEPPYLFRGVRPQVLNLQKTDFQRSEAIKFDIGRTNAPTAVVLQSTQNVTHMMNCGENRFLDLNFSQDGNAIEAIVPDDSLRALPGWYLLWVMVDDIPSVAKVVRIIPGKPEVETPPTAAFSASSVSGCSPLTVQFNNLSSANTTNVLWQFPGGSPDSSTDFSPSILYSNSGIFPVTLIAGNNTGYDTISEQGYVTIFPSTVAGFNFSINGTTVSFSNSSANGIFFAWNFGDGFTSTDINPSHIYTSDGSYTVTLIVTGPCNSDTITQTVIINTVSTNEVSLSAQFHFFPNPATASFTWYFDDPDTQVEIIRLCDVNGRVCENWQNPPLPQTLPISCVTDGLYFIEIQTKNQFFTQKIVIKR